MKKTVLIITALIGVIGFMNAQEAKIKSMLVASEAFADGETIPDDFACISCNGKNFSPPLSWEKIDKTVTYALICEDPDVSNGPYIHWIAFNIPADVTQLPQQAEIQYHGGSEGTNTAGTVGYTGPCPPARENHHYIFTVWALDRKLNLPETVTVTEFKKSFDEHIIAKGSVTGRYMCKTKQ